MGLLRARHDAPSDRVLKSPLLASGLLKPLIRSAGNELAVFALRPFLRQSLPANRHEAFRDILVLASGLLLFLGLGGASIFLFREPGGIATLWPANAAAVCLALSVRSRRVPHAVLGAVAANCLLQLAAGDPVPLIAGFSLANGIEILSMYALLQAHGLRRGALKDAETALLAMGAAAVACLPAAIVGGVTLHIAFQGATLLSVLQWWAGGTTSGIMVLIPFLAAGRRQIRVKKWYEQPSQLARELGLVLALTLIELAASWHLELPTAFAALTPLLWLAFRLRIFWTALVGAVWAVTGITLSATGVWPSIDPHWHHHYDAFQSQILLTLMLFPILFVAAYTNSYQLAQESLISSERRSMARAAELEAVFAGMSQGLSVFDENGHLMAWNRRYEEIYETHTYPVRVGMSLADVIRSRSTIIDYGGESEIVATAKLRELVSHGAHQTTVYTKKGRIISSTSSPIPGGGWIAIHDDITERREKELQLTQMQRMESLSQLTGGIAHDFNNILAVIIGNLQMALLADNIPPEREQVEAAITAARRGANMVSRLLSFARTPGCDVEQLCPKDTIAGLTEMLEDACGAAIAFSAHVDDTVLPILTDQGQLEMALINLTVNARDACRDGGQVKLTVTNAKGLPENANTNAQERSYVQFSISDNGRGIPRHLIERVTEPFFTTKEVGKGTGLGLSIVHEFVTRAGGFMRIDSTEGTGTTVSLYIPAANQVPASTTQSVAVRAPEHATVLVVDDQDDVRALVAAMFRMLGINTTEAADGATAIEILRVNKDIGLMLTDIRMPGSIDGVQLAEAARKMRPELRVILISGYPGDRNILQRAAASNFTFLPKPFDIESLRAALAASKFMAREAA